MREQIAENNKKEYIQFAKAVAVLLILNSHLDKIYPVSAIATGGAIGNALFFLISGYLWYSSVYKYGYFKWIWNKIKRIFLPTVITNIIYLLVLGNGNEVLFRIFIFPNKSWFCGAILLFAIIYYFVAKQDDKRIIQCILAILLIYSFWYYFKVNINVYSVESLERGGLCRYAFYAICMLVGLLLKKHEKKINIHKKKMGLFITFMAIALFYFDKFLMNKYSFFMQIQWVNQYLTLICAFLIFTCFKSYEDNLKKINNRIVEFFANYSWELYLTQTLIIPLCVEIKFPFSFLVILLGTCLSAFILRQIMNVIFRIIDRW